MESIELEVEEELTAVQLIAKKDSIEAEIKRQYELLEAQRGVGMKGPLVDSEGFPRADIDIYAVKTARNRVICLQNDHKAVMKEIEKKLHEIHADALKTNQLERREGELKKPALQGFVRVNAVSEGSPAALAGLRIGDEIAEFGSVNTSNFSSLQEIATTVQHSQERPLRVMVIRRGSQVVLSLTPRRWAGRGLLGCNVVPL